MFLAKKIITAFLIPPGLFISILLVFSLLSKKKTRISLLSFAILIYLFSTEPVKDVFLKPLEDAHPFPTLEQIKMCDAYVVLGSEVYEGVPDLCGTGELSEEAYQRTVNALRVYRLEKKPIILTGGSAYRRGAESLYGKRFLLSFGVNGADIITEAKSRDTQENAEYTKEIAEKKMIKRILLITNAYHMKRAHFLFSKYFEVVPLPVGYKTSRRPYDYLSFLPEASNLKSVACAMKEYMGLLYLRLFKA